MHVRIISIGKTKSSPCLELEEAYAKRIRGRFDCERITVKNRKELLARLAQERFAIVVLDEHATCMNSLQFASYLERIGRERSGVAFIVGDAEGMPDEIRLFPHDRIALSKMTLPHELARVLLVEQIYRSQTLLDGHPYHK